MIGYRVGVIMKSFFNSIFAGMLIFCSSYSLAMYQYTDEDMVIVDEITQQSNITESDVTKYKLLFLGGLAPLTALGTSGYASYKAGQALYQNPEYIGRVTGPLGKWVSEDYKPSESMQSMLTNKVLWVGVAAGGVMYGMYPVLYSRTKEGIIEKIKKFDIVCNKLAIAQNSYFDIQQLEQSIDPSWHVGNPIAWCAALDNLVAQGGRAQRLLNQLRSWGVDVSAWTDRIAFYNRHLVHNKNLFAERCNQLITVRRNEYGQQLKMQGEQAKVTGQYIKNVTGVWSILKDITTSGAKAVKFGYENKEAIAAAIGGGFLYSKYNQWSGK